MKIIALEEHFATSEIIAAWQALDPVTRDLAIDKSAGNDKERRLRDFADLRIAAMDEAGVDVAALSHTTPGVQGLTPQQAVPLARAANDLLAAMVRERPDRFQGFATLPTSAPQQAAVELRRAVIELGLNGAILFGRTGDRNLDHPTSSPSTKPRQHFGRRSISIRRRHSAVCAKPITKGWVTASKPCLRPADWAGTLKSASRPSG